MSNNVAIVREQAKSIYPTTFEGHNVDPQTGTVHKTWGEWATGSSIKPVQEKFDAQHKNPGLLWSIVSLPVTAVTAVWNALANMFDAILRFVGLRSDDDTAGKPVTK